MRIRVTAGFGRQGTCDAAQTGRRVIADLSRQGALAKELGARVRFVNAMSHEADVRRRGTRAAKIGALRGLVNCAGIAIAERTVKKDGPHALASSPASSPSPVGTQHDPARARMRKTADASASAA